MKLLFLCIAVFILETSGAYAQDYFRINDSDGFVNLRLKPNVESKVDLRVDDRECVIGLYSEGNWMKSIVFSLSDRILTSGFIHISRLVKDSACTDAANLKAVPNGDIILESLDQGKSFRSASTWFSANNGVIADDGFYAEGYSDYVIKSLANSFSKNLLVLNSLRNENPSFIQFVLKHINATGAFADLEKIANSKNKCALMKPSDICNQVIAKAEAALLNL